MSYCKVTRKFLPATEMLKGYDLNGRLTFYHPDVLENADYQICVECGRVDYFTRLDTDGNYHCHVCADNYATCEECGKLITNENDECNTDDNALLCPDCYDNATTGCEECGITLYYDSNIYELENSYLCEDCYNNLKDENVIEDYCYKPRPNMLKESGEDTNEFFGFEIEVAGDTDYANTFLSTYGDTEQNELYLKHDGSVEGFEIVTHPMTRAYFYKEFVPKMEKGMKYLRLSGFRGHNEGGIHIHVSQEAISSTQLKRMITLLYSKNDKTYKTWLAITQRNKGNMEHWANMNPDKLKFSGNKRKLFAEVDGYERLYNHKPYLNDVRYTAINTQNFNTVEFRIFNSSTRIERIIKNAEVVFSLIDFTENHKLPTMTNYLNFIDINKDKYSVLYDFLVEKQIYIPKQRKQAVKSLIKTAQKFDCNITDIEQLKRLIYTSAQNLNTDGDTDIDERNSTLCA